MYGRWSVKFLRVIYFKELSWLDSTVDCDLVLIGYRYLRKDSSYEFQIVCLQLINAIVATPDGPDELEFRLHLRNEIMRAGLMDILDVSKWKCLHSWTILFVFSIFQYFEFLFTIFKLWVMIVIILELIFTRNIVQYRSTLHSLDGNGGRDVKCCVIGEWVNITCTVCYCSVIWYITWYLFNICTKITQHL
jgi:hypothetical protein